MRIGAQQIIGDETRRSVGGVEMANDSVSGFVDRGSGVDALRRLAFDLNKYGSRDHIADHRTRMRMTTSALAGGQGDFLDFQPTNLGVVQQLGGDQCHTHHFRSVAARRR